MELIEFLMRNFWLVFIVIAILSGLSRGGRRQQDQNPNKSMPPFGGGNPQQSERERQQPSGLDTYDDEYAEDRGGLLERPEERGRRESEYDQERGGMLQRPDERRRQGGGYDESRGGMLKRPAERRNQPEVILSERQREMEKRMRQAAAVPDTRPQLAQEEIGSVDMIQERLKDSDSPIFNELENTKEMTRKANNLRQKAMEGIIWAEILGPPRSKKMHRKS